MIKDQIKAIIFDMDGVIVDSEPLHKESFLQVWEELGYGNNHGINFSDFYGTSDRTVWKAFIDKHKPKMHIDELILLRKKRLIKLLRDKKPIFDGVLPLIQHLASYCPIGLASGSVHHIIDEILKMDELRQYFRCIVSSEDVSLPKPSPEIFLLASKKLNVDPKYCCVIEDTINGVKAGKAAGMNVVAITNTFSIDQLSKSGADLVCQSYIEITKNLPF
ncbi:MAG: HAD family phosphatase [Verrucomicrobiota bacterium]|nr:HAD family phosphatase [Verrucomicrobiota bacterium]